MKLLHWSPLIAALMLLGACSSGPVAVPGISLFGPTATLPPPQVGVTSAPDAQAAMNAFLSALKNNDYASMYALLSSDSQAAVKQEDFAKRYNDALDTM